MTWIRSRSSVVRELPGTATAGVSFLSTPTGAPPVSEPSAAGNSGSDTYEVLTDLIERIKQLRTDVRDARKGLEEAYGGDRELGS